MICHVCRKASTWMAPICSSGMIFQIIETTSPLKPRPQKKTPTNLWASGSVTSSPSASLPIQQHLTQRYWIFLHIKSNAVSLPAMFSHVQGMKRWNSLRCPHTNAIMVSQSDAWNFPGNPEKWSSNLLVGPGFVDFFPHVRNPVTSCDPPPFQIVQGRL